MPAWLIYVCVISVVAGAAYLLYVIVRPEDF
ncbi:MAG: potassium-transporting ATPase subunit F [Rhodanobacteraceae bacterium]